MRVRPRAEADVERLLAIVARTHESDRYPRILPDVSRDFVVSRHEVAAWVAEADDVVGQVAILELLGDDDLRARTDGWGLSDGVVIVGRLFVDPSARGSGAGRALLGAATAGAHERGRRPILDVMKDAEAAIALYEQAGWERIGDVQRSLRGEVFDEWVFLGPERP